MKVNEKYDDRRIKDLDVGTGESGSQDQNLMCKSEENFDQFLGKAVSQDHAFGTYFWKLVSFCNKEKLHLLSVNVALNQLIVLKSNSNSFLI